MAKQILTTTLKSTIAALGYKDVKNLGPNAFGVVVAPTKVSKVIPDLMAMLKEYGPKRISDVEMRIGDKSVFAKNVNMQRVHKSLTQGRGNEFSLMVAIEEYRADYGKPITVEFTSSAGKKFVCKGVMKVVHVGAKDVFKRYKADIHLVTERMTIYPISIKDTTAGAWESADTYWGVRAKQFLMWALDKKHTTLVKNDDGGYSVQPPIAVSANQKETFDVVFGDDIYGKGAVVVQKFRADSFEWDYQRDVLIVKCAAVIVDEHDIADSHKAYFQIRNDRSRDPKFLHRGLRTIATMKNHLQGVKLFEQTVRKDIGI